MPQFKVGDQVVIHDQGRDEIKRIYALGGLLVDDDADPIPVGPGTVSMVGTTPGLRCMSITEARRWSATQTGPFR